MSDTILIDKTLESKSQEDDENKNVNENENENVNENGKTLMSSDKDDDYDDENENENEDDDDETIKFLNNILDDVIDKSKSSEGQIKLLEKREDLKGFWPYDDFGDKQLKFSYFKLKLAQMLKIIDKKLFE